MPEDTKWLRVTDKDNGVKRSIPEHELPHGNYSVLKQDTHDPITGDLLPPEFPTDSPAPSGQSATNKESK